MVAMITEDALVAAFRKTDFDLADWPEEALRDLARQVAAQLNAPRPRDPRDHPYDAMGDYPQTEWLWLPTLLKCE